MRAPIRDLYAALEKNGEGVRHVQYDDVAAAVFQLGPEWPESAPFWANQAQAHPLSVPDDVLVDAVVARVRTRVKAWPNRTGQRLRRRGLTEKIGLGELRQQRKLGLS